jgi:mRNA interferase RelE/StbE
MSQPYEIRYAAEAVADIRALRVFNQRKVLDGIGLHLTYQPKLVSRSRIKAMAQPFWSQYRLRIEDLRVYYDVDDTSHVVHVLRVLAKTTERTQEESP